MVTHPKHLRYASVKKKDIKFPKKIEVHILKLPKSIICDLAPHIT